MSHRVFVLGEQERRDSHDTPVNASPTRFLFELSRDRGTIWFPESLCVLPARLVPDNSGGRSNPQWCVLHGDGRNNDRHHVCNRSRRYVLSSHPSLLFQPSLKPRSLTYLLLPTSRQVRNPRNILHPR